MNVSYNTNNTVSTKALVQLVSIIIVHALLLSCSANSSSSQLDETSKIAAAVKAPTITDAQASLTLKGSAAGLCHSASRAWSIAKSGTLSEELVADWSVVSTKGELSTPTLKSNGVVTIQNTGSGEATIGSIVINLQRKLGKNWVTVSSDIANTNDGDSAISAFICSGASSEGLNNFAENLGSGSVQFTDVSKNTVFSLWPQKTLTAGEEVTLLFSAAFNNNALNIPANEQIRFEVIVTFGNAGARGGSGASCPNVDIGGNGTIEASETNVRSVPTRITLNVPPFYEHNQSVLLTDKADSISTTGTTSLLSFITDIGNGTGEEYLSASTAKSCQANVDSGADGGSITNCATLDSSDYAMTVNGPIDPITLAPSFSYSFTCEPAFHAQACHTLVVAAPVVDDAPFAENEYGTYTQGGWGAQPHGNNPAALLASHFSIVFPTKVQVGLATPKYSMSFTSAAAVSNYLPAGGTPKALTANLTNPTTSSSGVFGGQVLALKINVSFGDAGFTGTSLNKFADLEIINTGYSIDGMVVRDVLSVAEQALSGGGLPYDMSFSHLNNIVTLLNEAFDNGIPTAWAQAHLRR